MQDLSEQWLPIDGFPYEVSSLGRVRNARTGKILKPWLAGRGYQYVSLGGQAKRRVHRLVAFAFLGGPSDPRMQVCHNDGNPINNRVENLRWDTAKANQADRGKHGTTKRNRKLSAEQLAEIRQRLYAGEKQADIALDYGVVRQVISRIKCGAIYQGERPV